jgi:hypothetical protein
LGNTQVGAEELRAKIESAFLLDNTYVAEPYALRTLDCNKRLHSTGDVPLPMDKILELVLIKDLNPGVSKAHATNQALDGGVPLDRPRSTPDNSTAVLPDGYTQRADGRMPPAAAKASAPTGIDSIQLYRMQVPAVPEQRIRVVRVVWAVARALVTGVERIGGLPVKWNLGRNGAWLGHAPAAIPQICSTRWRVPHTGYRPTNLSQNRRFVGCRTWPAALSCVCFLVQTSWKQCNDRRDHLRLRLVCHEVVGDGLHVYDRYIGKK